MWWKENKDKDEREGSEILMTRKGEKRENGKKNREKMNE